jgi:hypothetical protein
MKFKGFIFVLASEIELGLGSQKEVVAPALNIETRDLRFFGSLSYATSPYANMLSALGGLGNSRVFAGFSPETLMVRGRNGRAFSLRIGGFSPKLEGWPIFPTRFKALT